MGAFEHFLEAIPEDKRAVKAFMSDLHAQPVVGDEAERYLVLQACSFGGKQIWYDNGRWNNACFRDYWEPTATSVRRSPANPMQPSATELHRRVKALSDGMQGVVCQRTDIMTILNRTIPDDAVVYVDPPYRGTTGYAYGFSVESFVGLFRKVCSAPLFVSEGERLSDDSLQLTLGGAKGGISGVRKGRHQEWLTKF